MPARAHSVAARLVAYCRTAAGGVDRLTIGRWTLFLAAVFQFVYRHPSRLTRQIPGNGGDALLTYALVRWDAHSLHHLLSNYWAGAFYSGAHLPMAYSDTLISVAAPFEIVHLVVRNPVLALNIVFIALWFLGAEFSYRLALRLTGSRAASVVGALAFAYSTILLAQTGHNQLFVFALLPLIIELELRLIERPHTLEAVVLGVAVAFVTLTSSYYAIGIVVFSAAIGALWLVTSRRITRQLLTCTAVALGVAAVLIGPFAIRYRELQRDPYFRRERVAAYELHAGDLRTVEPDATRLAALPGITDAPPSTSENYAFPGLVALALAPLGLVLAARRSWWRGTERSRRELLTLAAAGALLVFAITGPDVHVFGVAIPTTYRIVKLIPGFAGIRAIVRLFVFGQLVLAMAAAVGFALLCRAVDRRWFKIGLLILCIGTIGLTEQRDVPFVAVPRPRDDAATRYLIGQPQGVVLELPAHSLASGVTAAFVESPRMALAVGDFKPRVNGYSGFEPPGFGATVDALNQFPDGESLRVAAQHDVRYVVLRTAPLKGGEGLPSFYDEETARAKVAALPDERVAHVEIVAGAIVVTLR